MSVSEDQYFLEEHYDKMFGYVIRDDFLEAFEIAEELEDFFEGKQEDAPTEYEVDRVLDVLSRKTDEVNIVEEEGGNLYDVSNYKHENHLNIVNEWINQGE